MSLKCRTFRAMTIPCPYCRSSLVAGDDHPDVVVHQKLHMLSTTQGKLAPGPFTPHHGYCPLDLLHVDFTSIETTLEPNQSPTVGSVLVFQDHFTKHVLAYVTLGQTAKTLVKFLYQSYISIFGSPPRLLSDRGTKFMSSMIDEMC